MLNSYKMVVNYMTPLGLHHIMGRGHHYGPGPWVVGGRADWTSPYYHKADTAGIGFNRTATGSNALGQYADEISIQYSDPSSCPEKYLLWFHHLPWNYKMRSKNTLWDDICYTYNRGVKQVNAMISIWHELEAMVDKQRYKQISELMNIQYEEAKWWRNSCLLYFQQFSGMPFPDDIEQPEGELELYENMRFPYAPGIRPSW
jgi:alpha-glucuronidase